MVNLPRLAFQIVLFWGVVAGFVIFPEHQREVILVEIACAISFLWGAAAVAFQPPFRRPGARS